MAAVGRRSRRTGPPRSSGETAESDPGWTLHQAVTGKSQRWNVFDAASDAAMERLVRLAQARTEARHARRQSCIGSSSGSESETTDSEDEPDAAARERRRRAGGFAALLRGTVAAPPPIPDPAEVADLPEREVAEIAGVRRAWQTWRPWVANMQRVPEGGRKFTVADEDLARLSPEQLQATRILEAGASCFVTGPGGTGKTELIRVVHRAALAARLNVQVTASTGIAARNIGGSTLHRLAGLGLVEQLTQEQLAAALHKWSQQDRRRLAWKSIDLLIVDEISMLSMDFMLKVDAIARHCRDDRLPFGGIQLLLLGDFAQLTAAETDTDETGRTSHAFAFDHPQWPHLVPYTVLLATCFRQKESRFRDMLNRIRLGRPAREDMALLDALTLTATSTADQHHNHLGQHAAPPPELSAFRSTATDINMQHVQHLVDALGAQAVTYRPAGKASAGGGATPGTPAAHPHPFGVPRSTAGLPDAAEREAATATRGTTTQLTTLCVGARVLLTRNLGPDTTLVNGSIGTLLRFEDAPVGPAQPYPKLPVVQWDCDSRKGGTLVTTVMPVATHETSPEEDATLYMPLICAWGLTVHRAQGMTLPAAVVHAGTMRRPALLYTALSRVRDLRGLQLRGQVRLENVVAHPRVVHYYSCLEDMVAPEDDEDDEDTAASGDVDEEDEKWPPLAVVPSALLQETVGRDEVAQS
jgi:ATP-dependent DNA helicase PIF1